MAAAKVVRLISLVFCAVGAVQARTPSEIYIPPWCNGPGAVTVHEAGFHPTENAVLEYNAGTAAQAEGRDQEAIHHYLKTLELAPGFSAARNNLGVLYLKLRRIDLSLVVLQEAIRIDPTCASLYTNLALTYLTAGRPADAETVGRRASGLNPFGERNQVIVALALLMQGKLTAEAERTLGEVSSVHSLSIVMLARELSARGELESAKTFLNRFLALDGQDADARDIAGRWLHELDDPDSKKSPE